MFRVTLISRSKKLLFCKCIYSKQLQTLQVHKSHNVEGTGQHFVKGQIMYFLVNASTPKLFDISTSNFAGAKFTILRVLATGKHLVKVK